MLGLFTPSIHLLCSPFIAIQVLCIPIGYGPTHVSCDLVLEDIGGVLLERRHWSLEQVELGSLGACLSSRPSCLVRISLVCDLEGPLRCDLAFGTCLEVF